VELSISCSRLKNKDKLSTSDPFYVAYLCGGGKNDEYIEIGRSEIIANTLEPQWVHKVILTYNFQDFQLLRVEVYDVASGFKSNDSTDLDIRDQRFLGRCDISVGSILGNDKLAWFGPLVNRQGDEKKGYMKVCGEELVSVSDQLTLRLECQNIENKGVLGSSDMFIIISKCREDGTYTACYKSEVMRNNLSPVYEIQCSILELCNGDKQRPLRIEVNGWNSNGNHDFIGIR
jgi:copine 5/8/9